VIAIVTVIAEDLVIVAKSRIPGAGIDRGSSENVTVNVKEKDRAKKMFAKEVDPEIDGKFRFHRTIFNVELNLSF
jgi:hypothetical protein